MSKSLLSTAEQVRIPSPPINDDTTSKKRVAWPNTDEHLRSPQPLQLAALRRSAPPGSVSVQVVFLLLALRCCHQLVDVSISGACFIAGSVMGRLVLWLLKQHLSTSCHRDGVSLAVVKSSEGRLRFLQIQAIDGLGLAVDYQASRRPHLPAKLDCWPLYFAAKMPLSRSIIHGKCEPWYWVPCWCCSAWSSLSENLSGNTVLIVPTRDNIGVVRSFVQ